ncbi:MAG: DNA repair protein RecO [Parvularculaceae bacterium]
MEWSDAGIVLRARRHGEAHAIVELLTRQHGRHAGLVRGGAGRRLRPALEPGNEVAAVWRARLSENLGVYAVEPTKSRSAFVLNSPRRLAALAAACAVACDALPEREPHAPAYRALTVLLDALADDEVWPALFVKWELGLLRELGYGLALEACAVTGRTDALTHVSPRSGRAVCSEVAEPYKEKLLPLPAFLCDAGADITGADLAAGLALTGYFLETRIFGPADKSLPEARSRLAQAIAG